LKPQEVVDFMNQRQQQMQENIKLMRQEVYGDDPPVGAAKDAKAAPKRKSSGTLRKKAGAVKT
jgi:hypothetical protein